MTEELKPCAHCGKHVLKERWYRHKKIVECVTCLAQAHREYWNLRPSPWVRVEDGPPKSSDFMAVMNGNETWERAFYCDGDWYDEDEMLIKDITHWMPIPEIEG